MITRPSSLSATYRKQVEQVNGCSAFPAIAERKGSTPSVEALVVRSHGDSEFFVAT